LQAGELGWAGTDFMAKKKSKREYVWLECSSCGHRNYRTTVSVAEGTPKLRLKKFCKSEREHTVHKIRRK
jgi:large subunit ribosomal protein L33